MIKPIVPAVLRSKVSFFIDLYEKAELLLSGHPKLVEPARTKAQIDGLQKSLRFYQALSSAGPAQGSSVEIASIEEREPNHFQAIAFDYQSLLRRFLDAVVVRKAKPYPEMVSLIRRMGELNAGPRDLIDVHSAAIREFVLDKNEERALTVTVEGNLLAIEMMGLLVDFYRTGPQSNEQ